MTLLILTQITCLSLTHQLDLRKKLQWNFNKKKTFSFTIMHLKLLSMKWRPFCPGGEKFIHSVPSRCFYRSKLLPETLLACKKYISYMRTKLQIFGRMKLMSWCLESQETHHLFVDSPHKGPVMLTGVPIHNITMSYREPYLWQG